MTELWHFGHLSHLEEFKQDLVAQATLQRQSKALCCLSAYSTNPAVEFLHTKQATE